MVSFSGVWFVFDHPEHRIAERLPLRIDQGRQPRRQTGTLGSGQFDHFVLGRIEFGQDVGVLGGGQPPLLRRCLRSRPLNAFAQFRRALKIFSDKDLTTVVTAHPIGTVLILVVIYTFHDGIFKCGKTA
jgi:hypothetical protein